MIYPSINYQIRQLLDGGLRELDLSNFPFGHVREALEELGYNVAGKPDQGEFQYLVDWANGWKLDYCAYIYKDGKYTGYMIFGSIWDGTCKLVKEN